MFHLLHVLFRRLGLGRAEFQDSREDGRVDCPRLMEQSPYNALDQSLQWLRYTIGLIDSGSLGRGVGVVGWGINSWRAGALDPVGLNALE